MLKEFWTRIKLMVDFKMGKLLIVDIQAALYRKGIFCALDKNYDCEWFFGKGKHGIKDLDWKLLRHVNEAKLVKLIGHFYYQRKVIMQVFRKENITFLINGEPYCLSSWVISFLSLFISNKKVYYWSHGWYGRENWCKKIIKKVYFRLGDGTFTYGNYSRDLMIKENFNSLKIFTLHNSLDYESHLSLRKKNLKDEIYTTHFNNSRFNLIFIGRLTHSKRIDLLIEAMSLLKNNKEFFNLTLIGDGEAHDNIRYLVQHYGLEDSVWFFGASYDEMNNSRLIYNADVCISPGNVGLTAIHSMTFGTPVVTHNQFQYQGPEFEAIHEGVTGSFFLRDNVQSLADCISNWFLEFGTKREDVRKACYCEIDTAWTPDFQIKVFKQNLNM